jgi:hypothetical protein
VDRRTSGGHFIQGKGGGFDPLASILLVECQGNGTRRYTRVAIRQASDRKGIDLPIADLATREGLDTLAVRTALHHTLGGLIENMPKGTTAENREIFTSETCDRDISTDER